MPVLSHLFCYVAEQIVQPTKFGYLFFQKDFSLVFASFPFSLQSRHVNQCLFGLTSMSVRCPVIQARSNNKKNSTPYRPSQRPQMGKLTWKNGCFHWGLWPDSSFDHCQMLKHWSQHWLFGKKSGCSSIASTATLITTSSTMINRSDGMQLAHSTVPHSSHVREGEKRYMAHTHTYFPLP